MDHATIRMLLTGNGWKEKDIVQALTEQELTMPVPMPPDTGGAREAFLHLLTFGCLYTTVISLIVLFFTYINRLFPDVALEGLSLREGELTGIRWSMAAVIVAFPLLLWFSRSVLRDIARNPQHAASGIRRWLTYLTMLVTASAIVGTLITLVFYLLEGELSVRFLLKVLIILAFAGGTFSYYFKSLRLDPQSAALRKLNKTFLGLVVGVVVLALVWGALLIGSPMGERLRKMDDQRIEDFQSIVSEIYEYVYAGRRYEENMSTVNPVPQTLKEVLANARYQRFRINDPETGEPYGYKVHDRENFELCAVFSHPSEREYEVFWDHPAGEFCFSFNVEEDRYRF